MNNQYKIFLMNTFLFDGLSNDERMRLINILPVIKVQYFRGDVIYSPSGFERRIGFVYDGECAVTSPSSQDSQVTFNRLKAGASFGVTTLFSEKNEFPTVVLAKTNCSVLFIEFEQIQQLIEQNKQIALNIMRFMTNRIEFLNERIASFSAGTVERKLVAYILENIKRTDELEFCFNKKQCAEALGCGRASLYRALDILVSEELITLSKNKIIINDRTGLERKQK